MTSPASSSAAASGRIDAPALLGLTLDLDALWAELDDEEQG